MKVLKVVVLALLVLGLIASGAFAMKHTPEERGKVLFDDAKAFGGAKSCAECHPGGKGVEKSAQKKEFKIMGKTQKSLEEAINFCIVNASKGKAIDPKSGKMKDLVAYMTSLGKMPEKPKKSGGY